MFDTLGWNRSIYLVSLSVVICVIWLIQWRARCKSTLDRPSRVSHGSRSASYGNVTDSLLQCNFEGSEVGTYTLIPLWMPWTLIIHSYRHLQHEHAHLQRIRSCLGQSEFIPCLGQRRSVHLSKLRRYVFAAWFVNWWHGCFFCFSLSVVNNVSPNTGSTVGGTTLTITGNFFSDSSNYPLVVKVGGQPCTILSSDGSTIKCQTPVAPTSTPARFQGS